MILQLRILMYHFDNIYFKNNCWVINIEVWNNRNKIIFLFDLLNYLILLLLSPYYITFFRMEYFFIFSTNCCLIFTFLHFAGFSIKFFIVISFTMNDRVLKFFFTSCLLFSVFLVIVPETLLPFLSLKKRLLSQWLPTWRGSYSEPC